MRVGYFSPFLSFHSPLAGKKEIWIILQVICFLWQCFIFLDHLDGWQCVCVLFFKLKAHTGQPVQWKLNSRSDKLIHWLTTVWHRLQIWTHVIRLQGFSLFAKLCNTGDNSGHDKAAVVGLYIVCSAYLLFSKTYYIETSKNEIKYSSFVYLNWNIHSFS